MQTFTNSPIIEGLTFDDVLLIPAHSEVLPRTVDVSTKFTRDITLQTPIVSAAMDTVTEAELAIAMARAGGIGVIHKNMTIEEQMNQVRRVKRAENGMIYDPITIHPDATVGQVLGMMAQHHIGGIPVVDDNGFLVGIVTNRDLRFQRDPKMPVSEIMTRENLVTAKKGISLPDATDILRQHKIEKLPVVDADGKLVGLITYKDLMKIKDNPIASKDSKGRLLVAAAVGVKSDTIERIEMLVSAGADAVVVDTAHGHSQGVLNVIKSACDALPDVQIVAGNVATAEGAKALADAGVSAVKVGIGPGSICTTRQFIGGMLAGLGGAIECLGIYQQLNWEVQLGYGFDGMLIAIIAKNNPLMVPVIAFILSYIRAGGDLVNRMTDVPTELVSVIQSLVVIFIAAKSLLAFVRHHLLVKDAMSQKGVG